MELTFRCAVSEPVRSAILAAIEPLRILEDLIRWGASQAPVRTIADVVVQDEYTHDVIMPWDAQTHLVFDTT